jgi:hypothetical protein
MLTRTHACLTASRGAGVARLAPSLSEPPWPWICRGGVEASQIVRVSKGGGSAPPAAPERVGPPASQFVVLPGARRRHCIIWAHPNPWRCVRGPRA